MFLKGDLEAKNLALAKEGYKKNGTALKVD